MKSLLIITFVLSVCLRKYNGFAYSLPGPRVYVVTPSPRPLQIDEGRSEPFYYHNWMRRMDSDISKQNSSSHITSPAPKVRTPDLIFAEFESDSNDSMKKSLRKLLEKEKIVAQTSSTTTSKPIYVPDEDFHKMTDKSKYGLPYNVKQEENVENTSSSQSDYYSMYNNWYKELPSPVFLPATTKSTTTTTVTTTTTAPEIQKVENIWHIIDSEKNDQYASNWEEVPLDSNKNSPVQQLPINNNKTIEQTYSEDDIDENFALPGFESKPGNGAENESRAIRYEPNIRFPYVNLKPFQLKPSKKPLNNIMDNKKGNTLMTNLNNFHDLKNPVRGEAQDVIPTLNIVDRYNPAQPYLPPSDYGSKLSKQNSVPTPSKATGLLAPPPPPPSQKQSGNDFPALSNPYESFPPYAPQSFDSVPSFPSRPVPSKTPTYTPVIETSDDSGTETDSDSVPDNGPPSDIGVRYKPPSPPVQHYIPSSPISKPFPGYSYEIPSLPDEEPMMPSMEEKPEFVGYHYSKPETAPQDDMPPSYGVEDAPPIFSPESDYSGLTLPKPPEDMDDAKESDPGFPSDFPAKHYFEVGDHDFYHHHHHHPTTTTTTTEMPRVNRYSYYYLGKKLYYLPLYFSVYFIVYVGALIIKAVLRHKIVYPNSWRPNTTTSTFFSKRSVDAYLSNENLHEVTGKVTHAIATAAERYLNDKLKK